MGGFLFYHRKEKLVHRGALRELRVEGGGKHIALPRGDYPAVDHGKRLRAA
jgi:hypothetical protein